MGMLAREMCTRTHCLLYMIHATCLGFQNLFFSFTDDNNVDDPEEAFYELAFSWFLLFFYVFKTAAYAMYQQWWD